MTSASNNEALNVITTTMGTHFNTFPIIPGRNINGTNATMVVRTVAVTGHITSFVPSIAAWLLDFPISICRKTFSVTIIASSTSIPITRMIPNIVIMLIVTSTRDMIMIATKNANGIPSAVRNASLTFKNIGKRHMTNANPKKPLFKRTPNRRLITNDSKSRMLSFMPSLIFSFSLATSFLTSSATLIVSALCFLTTSRITARDPFARTITDRSANVLVTEPTSRTVR